MAPTTPLLLVDNIFDTAVAYPTATLTATSERAGHEAFRLASYRRERQSWQTATSAANHAVSVDLTAASARDVDSIFLDRGHNLWGKTVTLAHSPDGTTWTVLRTFVLPAAGTLAGDPATTTGAVTEEGAWWALFTGSGAAKRWWRVAVTDVMVPVITGLLVGARTQMLGYSSTFDEDAGERTEAASTSTAGYRGADTTYSWRTVELGLAYIGSAQYDATIRTLRTRLFDRNQPAVIFLDYATRPERGWMYQMDGRSWGMPKTRVYRSGRLKFREVGASLT